MLSNRAPQPIKIDADISDGRLQRRVAKKLGNTVQGHATRLQRGRDTRAQQVRAMAGPCLPRGSTRATHRLVTACSAQCCAGVLYEQPPHGTGARKAAAPSRGRR